MSFLNVFNCRFLYELNIFLFISLFHYKAFKLIMNQKHFPSIQQPQIDICVQDVGYIHIFSYLEKKCLSKLKSNPHIHFTPLYDIEQHISTRHFGMTILFPFILILRYSSVSRVKCLLLYTLFIAPPRNRGGVIFSLQFVCVSICLSVCPILLVNKFQPNGCTDLDTIFAKRLLSTLAQTPLKMVTLGQR